MTTAYQSPIEATSERTKTNVPFWIVFGIALYIPFEEFVLRWLPGLVPVALRFVPELILYGLLITVCGNRIIKGYKLRSTPIDLLLVAFFLATAVSMVINGSALFRSIVNLRTMWRYLSVFYIVVNIDISRAQLRQLLQSLKVVFLIQGVLSAVQYFLPAGFNQAVFAPRGFEFGDFKGGARAADGLLKVGATAGTFSDSAVLSAFLLVGLCLSTVTIYATGHNTIPSYGDIAGFGSLLFGIFASKKRAALGLAILIPLVVFYVCRRKKLFVGSVWFYATVGTLALIAISIVGGADTSFAGSDARTESIGLSAYFLQIFSADYWQNSSEQSRGWFVRTIVNGTLVTKSFFGFGPDFDQAQSGLRATLSTAADMAKLQRDEPVFDDAFWFAFFAYFGVVGTALYAFMLKRLYDASKWLTRVSTEPEYRAIGGTFATLLLITVLYAFVERILRLRAFSFYFWLLAGLMVNTCHLKMAELSQKRRGNTSVK
ncbi:MAG: hypothetical protein AAFY72_10545 [Cyanobacteria bacterium J06649_4]